jgi:hypothetical protein
MCRQLGDESRHLWEQWSAARGERERELGRLLDHGHRDNTVLVMTLNRGFTDLLLNWVASCDHHGIEVRSWTLIVALDTATAGLFESMGFAVYCDETSYGSQSMDPAKVYGDPVFTRMMFPKTAVVRDVLDLGFDVLFQDVDVIWKRDPGQMLFHPQRQALDVQFMYDGPNRIYQPLHANTGFFHLRNTAATVTFWNLVCQHFDEVLRLRSQQRVVNVILAALAGRDLAVDILPEAEFANGHLFSLENPHGLPDDPYVVHCSWTKNIEHKLEKYRLAGLWYLGHVPGPASL